MKNLLILFVLSCINSFDTAAYNKQTLKSALTSKVSEFPNNAQLSAALVHNDEIYFLGLQKTENGVIEIENRDSVFEIGELTKIFTAAVLSNYVLDGKINLDDEIKEVIPMQLRNRFTFKQLANHHSGLDRNPTNMLEGDWTPDDPFANYTDEMIREFFKNHCKIIDRPGESYHYSNIGFGLLGFSLARIEAVPIHELITEMILKKYGMSKSCFEYERCNEFMVKPLKGFFGEKTNYWSFESSMCAMGGMRSTSKDMISFLKAHFNSDNEELLLSTKKTAVIKQKESVGLGWHIANISSAGAVCYAKGRTAGFTSVMGLDVSQKLGIIILSNQTLVDLDRVLLNMF